MIFSVVWSMNKSESLISNNEELDIEYTSPLLFLYANSINSSPIKTIKKTTNSPNSISLIGDQKVNEPSIQIKSGFSNHNNINNNIIEDKDNNESEPKLVFSWAILFSLFCSVNLLTSD